MCNKTANKLLSRPFSSYEITWQYMVSSGQNTTVPAMQILFISFICKFRLKTIELLNTFYLNFILGLHLHLIILL